jgi:hypothetical protein
MDIRTGKAARRAAWKVLTSLKRMGSKGHTLLTIVSLIAIWGICASVIYWLITALWEIGS